MSRRKVDPLDAQIEAAWYRQAHGVQVNIMDIPRIFRFVREHVAAGGTVEAGVELAITAFRVSS